MVRNENKWLVVTVIVILVIGTVLTVWSAQDADTRLREDLLTKTRIMERGLLVSQIEGLTGTEADLQSNDYMFLKRQLQQMRSADPLIRFTYIMGKNQDGDILFLVDSEPPDSEDYSPPGQEFPEASDALQAMFDTPTEVAEGPVADRWGTWVSGLVPVTDPLTGKVIAVYGMDMDANDWSWEILIDCIPSIIGILLIVLLLLVFTNIRRRDQREKEILEQSERRLNDLINFLPDPTFAIDLNGKVISWNRAMAEITGIVPEEILGKGDYEYALPFYGERRPILIDLIYQPQEVISKNYTNITREKDILIADTSSPRLQGKQVWLMGKAGPLYDQDGEVVGAIESIRDMTFRKAAEEALRRSEEKFRILLQNVNDGIIVHELTPAGFGTIIDVNPRACEILGLAREELVNHEVREFNVALPNDRVPQIAQEFAVKKFALFETEFIKKDGNHIPVEVSSRLFELQDKSLVLASFRDITERRQVEQEKAYYTAELQQYADALQRTNSKLNLLNSITRHDILNQVTGIMGFLDLLKLAVPEPALRKYIDPALLSADNIRNYIQFSKEYQEIGVQSPRWFSVHALISTAAAWLPLDPVKLTIDIDNLEIYADPLVEKVFYTLIENGLRHGKKVTMIRFSSHLSGTSMVIAYSDDGVGVQPEYKDGIFNRTYYSHTGYGLFLSREILAITGITIHETGEYTKGARFEIIVPENVFRFSGPD